MACFKPIHGFRAPGGTIKMSRSGAYRDLPITVPCGQCIGCRLERSRQWAVRCVHEAQMHEKNCFLTLTYNDENLPADGSLDVTHWQKFAKRMRKNLSGKNRKENKIFRFFHCGEYGEATRRPHYHAAVFGQDFSEDRKYHKSNKSGHPLYTSKYLDQMWTHGHCYIGELTFESAAYVARYIMKKVTGPLAEEHYNGLKPEYVTMSRMPGIGNSWYNKFKSDVYPSDEIIIRGKRSKPPKYYDQLLEAESPETFKVIRQARAIAAAKIQKDNTPDRLEVREICKEEQIKQLTRDL